MQISQTYANENAFNAYVKYLAFKKHFTTDSYDYVKYRGKVKASFDKFRTRNDAFFFNKLALKEDYENLIMSNVIVKPEVWVRDIVDMEGEDRYTSWKKKIDSLSYLFKTELLELKDDYKENFISQNGQHPYIMTLYLQKKISLETFTILCSAANIFPYWEKIILDKFVACDIIRLARKYRPFLAIEEVRYTTLVKDRFLL